MTEFELSIDQQLTYEVRAKNIRNIIEDRNEDGLLEYCSQTEDPMIIPSMIGVLRAYYRHDKDSFEWAMYVLSLHKGHEEILANFFIATYQVNNKLMPQEVIDALDSIGFWENLEKSD